MIRRWLRNAACGTLVGHAPTSNMRWSSGDLDHPDMDQFIVTP